MRKNTEWPGLWVAVKNQFTTAKHVWNRLLPKKYGLAGSYWKVISDLYEDAKTRSQGIKEAIKYVKSLEVE